MGTVGWRVTCPHCRVKLKWAIVALPIVVRCPACWRNFRVKARPA